MTNDIKNYARNLCKCYCNAVRGYCVLAGRSERVGECFVAVGEWAGAAGGVAQAVWLQCVYDFLAHFDSVVNFDASGVLVGVRVGVVGEVFILCYRSA